MNKTTKRTLATFKDEFAPDADVVFLRRRVAELEAKQLKERTATGEAMEIIHALKDAITEASPVEMVYRPQSRSESPCTHVLHLSDWHYGAMVDVDEVDGWGEYSPEIAERRVASLTNSIINKTIAQRHGYNVPHLHILGTADWVSGDIHQELQVTNAFPAPVQAVRCGYLLGGMLAAFAPHFETVTADLITLDNHGRLTVKPQSAQGGLNNWGYIVGEIAAQYVKQLSNVKVNVHAKPSALVSIGPERYLCFHGHQVKAWAGIPYYGLDRRAAMEAVKRMGFPDKEFTRMVSGHLHTSFNGDLWRLGGSLSGTDAFDHNCGRNSKPNQTSWFVHPRHSEFDWTRWWVS